MVYYQPVNTVAAKEKKSLLEPLLPRRNILHHLNECHIVLLTFDP